MELPLFFTVTVLVVDSPWTMLKSRGIDVKIIDDALLVALLALEEPPLLLLLLDELLVQLPGVPNAEAHVSPELQLATPCHAPELQDLVVIFVTQMFVPEE